MQVQVCVCVCVFVSMYLDASNMLSQQQKQKQREWKWQWPKGQGLEAIFHTPTPGPRKSGQAQNPSQHFPSTVHHRPRPDPIDPAPHRA